MPLKRLPKVSSRATTPALVEKDARIRQLPAQALPERHASAFPDPFTIRGLSPANNAARAAVA